MLWYGGTVVPYHTNHYIPYQFHRHRPIETPARSVTVWSGSSGEGKCKALATPDPDKSGTSHSRLLRSMSSGKHTLARTTKSVIGAFVGSGNWNCNGSDWDARGILAAKTMDGGSFNVCAVIKITASGEGLSCRGFLK